MQIEQIAEYEVSYRPEGEPALSFFHVVRGREVARLGAAEVAELRELLAVAQKRIRSLGDKQLILGAGGDLSLYAPSGQRACYLNADQAQTLARLLGAG
ncbi:hypothetical protein EKD04_007675 [Chloroflexales bacterium ZM16-3]|nr:hypothetical protein [Chloroflexales bacterium ZM16-3]